MQVCGDHSVTTQACTAGEGDVWFCRHVSHGWCALYAVYVCGGILCVDGEEIHISDSV